MWPTLQNRFPNLAENASELEPAKSEAAEKPPEPFQFQFLWTGRGPEHPYDK